MLTPNAHISIIKDDKGIAEILHKKLVQQHYQAHVISNVSQLAKQTDCIISLTALNKINTNEEAIDLNKQLFKDARVITKQLEQGGLFIIVQDIGGYFGLRNATEHRIYSAGMSGLLKTIIQEYPLIKGKCIDLAQANLSSEILADKIIKEIMQGGNENEVGLPIDEERVVLSLQLAEPSPDIHFHLPYNPVLVATGGGYGITAACLCNYAQKTPMRIALIGRTILNEEPPIYRLAENKDALQSLLIATAKKNGQAVNLKEIKIQLQNLLTIRQIRSTISKLENVGTEVMYLAADIQNLSELQKALAKVRKQWGRIDGFIHGAGVLADKKLNEKTDTQFDYVFNTKVLGLLNLLNATAEDHLSLIIVFSSIAARFGNTGQVDYAMANEILNKVAQCQQQKRGSSCLVKSFNWGPWEYGMVDSSLKNWFKERGIDLLTLENGCARFTKELNYINQEEVEVVIGGTLHS